MMIHLIDVSGFIYRSFYALPSLTYKAQEVGALYGFCVAMLRIMSMFHDSMFVAALDSGKKTFRNEIYAEYKANRKNMPEELVSQIPLIREACEKFGFAIIEKKGFEADDIIASCVRKFSSCYKLNIISSDKDLTQLISEKVSIYDPMKQKFITDADVLKKFGVTRDKVLDVLSLMGDSSDNIPGVPGIGPKTASSLINEFGSLDSLIANLDKLPQTKRNMVLKSEINKAILSRDLVRLKDDLDIDDIEFKVSNPCDLEGFFAKYGFRTLVSKISKQPKDERISIPLNSPDNNILFIEANGEELPPKDQLEDAKILKVVEDLKSLYKFSFQSKIDLKNCIDLSVMSYCLSGSLLKHTLESMCEFYGDRIKDGVPNMESIYYLLSGELDQKSKRLFFEIENKLVKVLAQMEYTGIKVDVDYLKRLAEYFEEKIKNLSKEIYEIAGLEFNIGSPKQVAFLLYEKLKIPTNKKSTDAETLGMFRGLHRGIADKILDWRMYSKLLNTYVKSLVKLVDENERVHTTYSQTIVNTGRLSSSDPNLQNIPKRTEEGRKIRRAFIARKGYKLVSLDYSQMELRLLAHLADCRKLKESFIQGMDIHKATALHIFGLRNENDVTPDQRRIAKEINFSILYGVSIHTLAQRLELSYQRASEIYSGFLGLYPEVLEYMKLTEDFAKKNGYVETIFGRKCFVPLINSRNRRLSSFAERQAMNAPIQGSNADIIKLAMVKINELKEFDFEILLQIHDELIVEVSDDCLNKATMFLKDMMENVVTLTVPIPVDIKIGPHL